MLYTLGISLLLFCFFLPNASGTEGVVEISKVSTDEEIRKLDKKVPYSTYNKGQVEYFDEQYVRTGELALPVTKLAIAEVKVKLNGGWFISLAGHCGPALHLLKLLLSGNVEAGFLVVVYNPKQNIDNADHIACVKILTHLKKNEVKIYKFKNPDPTEENKEMSLSVFEESWDAETVVAKMTSVNFLVISLCGVSVANEKRTGVYADHTQSQRASTTPTLENALAILQDLAKGKTVVLEFSSANGQAEDGSWPFDGQQAPRSEHHVTHIITQYWPMKSLETNIAKGARTFILKSLFLDNVPLDHEIGNDAKLVRDSFLLGSTSVEVKLKT